MFQSPSLSESRARHDVAERVARASSPRLPATGSRRRAAQRLRRLADRLDS